MNALLTPLLFYRFFSLTFLFSSVFITNLFYSKACVSQTLLFRERFNNSSFNTYSLSNGWVGDDTIWSMTGSGTDWGSRISGGFMEITNDASAATNSSGWTFACFDNRKLSAPWSSSLNNNNGMISWTFNMRQSRTDPSGFTNGSYGVALILAGSNNSPFNSGFGYAVVLGQAGTTDPLRLVRYNNGLSGILTNIIVSNTSGLSDFGNEYLSVDVRYLPATNRWELLVRNDGSGGFNDPASGILISQGTAIDNIYTSGALIFTGCYWCGNTAILQNAIFDNIQISSGCANSMLYYRTKKSGSWHHAENWEMSEEENGYYRSACYYPHGSGAIKVRILNGHTAQIESGYNISFNQLIIDSAATFILNNNASMDIANGNPNGADLEIKGTFIDNANAGFGINFIPNSGAAWMMARGANLIRTNGSSAIPYRDNYQDGMINIPSNANWIIRYQGKNVPFTTIATSPCPCSVSFPSATYYPNLIFESNNSTWNTASSIGSRFNGTNAYATVKGNLIIGGQGTGGVMIYNENNNPTPMLIEGNMIIKSNSMLSNDNSFNPNQTGTGFEVKGNLITEGALYINGSGTLILSGDKIQSISGNGNLQLNNLVINNTGGFNKSITLNRPVTIHGELKLINGIVYTDNINSLTLQSGATVSGGGFKSFINGPMQKNGSSDFRFPVGKPSVIIHADTNSSKPRKAGGYRPIWISDLTKDEQFTAEYHLSDPYTAGSISEIAKATGLQSISRCEYWDLKSADSTSSASVTLSWSDNEIEGQSQCNIGPVMADSTYAVVVPFYNQQWGYPLAPCFGKTSTCSADSLLIRTIMWDGKDRAIKSFNKFVIGSTNFNNAPLTAKIKKFEVEHNINHIYLKWDLLSNDEPETIVIERSRDGIHFNDLKHATIRKAMYSYSETDSFPFSGRGYYRLRISDQFGFVYYSSVRQAVINSKEREIIITPNPAGDMIFVRIEPFLQFKKLLIINSKGSVVIRQQLPLLLNMINISSLKRGIYFMRIEGKEKTVSGSFFKE